jgi:peptide/nickel transport system substrate-binding protein
MRRTPMLVVPLVLAGLVACSGSPNGSSSDAGYAAGGTFTMAFAIDLGGGFDPYRSTQGVLTALNGLAYDSLVNQRPDGTFVSGLAEKWEADARTATFTLRKGVTCSDGTPLTAGQIADDVNYVSDPKNESPQYGVNTPAIPLTATGDDASGTVKVTVHKPYGFLLHTIGRLPIVCAKGFKDPSTLKTTSSGTGPFVLTKMVPGQSYTFSVRKDYTWGPDGASTSAPGTPATVVVKIITNETTAANLLLSGELNLSKVTGADAGRIRERGLASLKQLTAAAWLSFNQRGGRPTGDERVRRALVSALDHDEVVKVSTAGAGVAAKGLTAVEPRACTDDTVTGQLPQHDLAAAEAALDEAGWLKGPDGIRRRDGKTLDIDLHYGQAKSPLDKPTAELLSQKWKALGVKVKLTADSAASGVEALYETSNWDVYLQGFGFQLPSQMVPYLSGEAPPKGVNQGGIDNKQYNQLAAKAEGMVPDQGCAYWKQAEQAILRTVGVAPLSNRPEHWFLNKAEAELRTNDTVVPTSIRILN